MIESLDFYRSLRAKPGYAHRKAFLIARVRELTDDITHYIIAGSASVGVLIEKNWRDRQLIAEEKREAAIVELLSVTFPPKKGT